MNAIVSTHNPALPAHLAALAANSGLAAVSQNVLAAATGVGMHRVSIKQSRWRLQDPQGQEQVAQTLHLDVIIVGANSTMSKLYYANAYDPNADLVAPDCWSDNGVAPSAKAKSPQCGTCAQCPHNVWGSKVMPNGKEVKACADARKIAVILADNPNGPVYQLKIPAASMKNLSEYTQALKNRSADVAFVVTRLTFDTATDYPHILFTAANWISSEQAASVNGMYADGVPSAEITKVIGTDDKPYEAKQLTGPSVQGVIAPPMPAPAPVVNAAIDPFAGLNQGAALAPAPQNAAMEPKKRGRKPNTAVETNAALNAAQPSPAATFFASAAAAQQKQDVANAKSAAASVVTNPGATDANLDALLAAALSA